MTDDILTRFSPATADWFRGAFATPTAAQQGAWEAISSGRHALVVAPTGSGKTLSAFLWALDRLATTPTPVEVKQRCRVVYVSPLKALAVDVERNLRSPLVGIGHAAQRLGLPAPKVTVAVRSGDTPTAERRVFAKTPADILITTPESLFLLLTSAARESLAGVETVILDEVHAVAGTKRGAHLALTLERLDALLPTPAQRIGLSATVRPVEEVARFLAGGRPVDVVAPPSTKAWDLRVVVPVPDLGSLGEPTGDLSGPAAGDPRRTSIWPHVEERIVDLVAEHRSTLVFANSRRLAERLTTRLNEIWDDRTNPDLPTDDEAADAFAGPTAARPGDATAPTKAPATTREATPSVSREATRAATPASRTPTAGIPAQVMAQAGAARGAPALLARAHHGSVSREQRSVIEEDLKAGRLPAVVATSSLELGIDMGAVDLVVQVESPPSVASGLQRVGRAGHQVGAVSRGVLFPKFRGDLVQTAVVVERMRAGAIESLRVPANPLDVLAQQIVAMCALQDWDVEALHTLVRRAAPFAGLSRLVLDSVLDMLSGRYPSDEFAELRPRVVWDRVTGTLSGRRGAQRLAVTSGGTIPDRGLYAVFLASGDGPGRRVGELDEEMVYESRVGDTFTLGTSTWRIEDITHDRVLVTPAPGQPGKLPFWKGDTIGRPPELGAAVGAFVREVGSLGPSAARERVAAAGLDEWATDNLLGYLSEQREAAGHLPSDRTIVVERFRDELGDWRVIVHSPYGGQVHAPWALAIAARMRERYGIDVQAMHGDDGIVLRLPDMDLLGSDGWGDDAAPAIPVGTVLSEELLGLIFLDPDEIAELVTAQVGGSALFAARFRECAARALLLPRRRPDRRQALWQQRQRAAALLEVASQYPSFPIVLEAVRECVQDVFDVPGLVDLLRRVRTREITTVSIESATPSPFARSLMFGYVAQFLYEGDSPLAEKRAAALALDPTLLSELLGHGETLALRDLLDPTALSTTEAELAHLTPERAARDAEDLADLIRSLGPLDSAELAARVRPDSRGAVSDWLVELERARRIIQVRIAGRDQWAVVEDAGRLRDALGVSLPVGIPQTFLAPEPDPLADLVARHARTHGPFGAADVAARFGLGVAVVRDALARLVSSGRVVEGELRPLRDGGAAHALDYCDARVLRLLRRRSLAALRAEVEPVGPRDLARFLIGWQHLGGALRGVDGVLRVVEQLAGAVLPASALESLVLPSRVMGYHPGLLDEAMAAGEVLWQGHGSLPGDDGWVSLHPADLAPLTLHPPLPLDLTPTHTALVDALAGGGAYFFGPLLDRAGHTDSATGSAALWELVWAGWVSGDTLAPLRAHLGGGRTAHRPRATAPRRSLYAGRAALLRSAAARSGSGATGAAGLGQRTVDPRTAGRWALLPAPETDPTVTAYARAEVLLDRYGVLTRGAVAAEDVPGGFAGVYRLLSAAEEAGRVRRGYFVEGLGASQFGSTGAVDRLRAGARPLEDGREPVPGLILAACDPANPYGAALPWPERPTTDASSGKGHQPSRKAGALVALVDGELVLYVERGGRTLLTWNEDPTTLQAAADALALAVREGALGRLTVERTDGESVLRSDHPLATALETAGFHATSRGLRIRR